MNYSRRHFLSIAGAGCAGTLIGAQLHHLFTRAANGASIEAEGYGPLIPDPHRLLDLPRGFQYRAFSHTGERMSDGFPVPALHDGMAAFPGPRNTTVLIRNHELSPNQMPGVQGDHPYDPQCTGGTTTLILDSNRRLLKHYASLTGTYRNCAGGPTPWESWISCEENTSTPESDPAVSKRHGYNFEVPLQATRPIQPQPLVAMGRFHHEAVAVDPESHVIYQTEDREDGLFYRFIPKQPQALQAGGVLEALRIKGFPQLNTKQGIPIGQPLPVEWVRIQDPDPATDSVRVEGFAKGAAQFCRGEGICLGQQEVWFCCTSGGTARLGQIWRYIPGRTLKEGGTLTLFAEPNDPGILDYPDNLVMAPFGDLFLCEDGRGEQFIRGINAQGQLYRFARNALNDKELAGVCFARNPLILFVNLQTPGITFAIWGPFV
ncbi:alkaline phosphatase PhoX [Acaryochloris sp. IP29b_bin.148]|uniref:alkaline phosphatase PhoX n=1 Tax=Acaryochloris sp. IP29b_bin.148 TaxID=2969218 RepID=UPI002627BC7E|nr:alkaline phosphatase PhoX [Acaryochloris sp. IP29b_bin.148]